MNKTTRRGFTLLELLTVIGVIAILVSILIPLAGKMRKMAQTSDTKAQISKLVVAIQSYYQDFRAYPGPVPEENIVGFNGNMTPPNPFVASAPSVTPPAPSPQPTALTSTQNLVLGLVGGGANSGIGGAGMYFWPNLIPNGPQNLSPLNFALPKAAYVQATPDELYRDLSGNLASYAAQADPGPLPPPAAHQSSVATFPGLLVPEFLDRFSNTIEQRGHPILYLRARVGAPFIVDSFIVPPPAPQGQTSQYFSAELSPYWWGGTYEVSTAVFTPNPNNAPFPSYSVYDSNQLSSGTGTGYPWVYYSKYGGLQPASGGPPVPPSSTNPAVDFFKNPSIDDGHTPRGKDAFILISAGLDGIYGNDDDILYP